MRRQRLGVDPGLPTIARVQYQRRKNDSLHEPTLVQGDGFVPHIL
jgi:hypothetical protein